MDLRTERALPPEARQEALFVADDSAGIFVGVRFCDEPLMTPVDFAADDAVDLAYVFVVELGLIPAAKVRLALSGEPQKESSQRFLNDLLALGAQRVAATASVLYRLTPEMALQTGTRGLFVFSFAGHGFFGRSGDLLVTREFVARRPADTGLPLGTLLGDIAVSIAPRRLVFLDACRTHLRSGRSLANDAEAGASLVFTGTLIDILRGHIDVPASGPYLTLGHLAGAADAKIRHWIALHRGSQPGKSLGISSTFDPESMRGLPLAAHSVRLQEHQTFRLRSRQALAKLKSELEAPLSGAILDGIRHQLDNARSLGEVRLLIEAIERLDGGADAREALLAIFEHRRQSLAVPAASPRKFWKVRTVVALLVALSAIAFATSQLPRESKAPDSEQKNLVQDGVAGEKAPAPNPGGDANELSPPETEKAENRPSEDEKQKNVGREPPRVPPVGAEADLTDTGGPARGRLSAVANPQDQGGTYLTFNQTLAQGNPQFLANFDATLAVGFSTELGVDVATLIWAPQGREVDKKPIYSAGAEFTFPSSKGEVAVQIVEVDWPGKKIHWSAQLHPRRLDCKTKGENFDRSPAGFAHSTGSRFGINDGAFQTQLTLPNGFDKRCIDCRVKAKSYRAAVTVWADRKASAWGLYLLDMSEVRGEWYSLDLDPQNRVAMRHHVGGRSPSTLWSGTLDTTGKIHLEMEAKEGRLSAWADGKRLASLPLDFATIPEIPLGTGFVVYSGNDVPTTAFFDDYELTTCSYVGG